MLKNKNENSNFGPKVACYFVIKSAVDLGNAAISPASLYDPIAVKFLWEFSEFSELSEFSEFSFLALKIDFFPVKKITKKMENRMSIIFEKNAK